MKKTLAIALVTALALTLGVIAFAEDISDVLSSAPAEVEKTTEADEAIEVIPAEEAPVEETPVEEAPAEEIPVEEASVEDASKPEPIHIYSNGNCTAEEASYIHAVLGNRIQTWYSSFDVDENGNEYESYNYELPEEIAEKYGTRDCKMLPPIMIFESIGELDSTETFEVNYGTRNYYFESDDVKYTETVKRTEVYEVVIPAGEVAFCVLDPGDYDISEGETIMLSGGKNISATYGDLTLIFDD